MSVLLDTDILLDLALTREPHATASAAVLRWAESGGATAIAWHSVTNCAYLLKGGGRPFLDRLLRFVKVAPVTTADAQRALTLPMSDVADAFQAAAARLGSGRDRDPQHFRLSPLAGTRAFAEGISQTGCPLIEWSSLRPKQGWRS